jgi:hypothetical protein
MTVPSWRTYFEGAYGMCFGSDDHGARGGFGARDPVDLGLAQLPAAEPEYRLGPPDAREQQQGGEAEQALHQRAERPRHQQRLHPHVGRRLAEQPPLEVVERAGHDHGVVDGRAQAVGGEDLVERHRGWFLPPPGVLAWVQVVRR